MVGGHLHEEQEPKERCPYCRALCCADFVDVGVGFIQCGPYHCESCLASEIGPHDGYENQTALEEKTGWYEPGKPAGSSANIDNDGNIIRHFEADSNYRDSLGVLPRYDKHGRPIKS